MPSDVVAEGDIDRAVIRAATGLDVPEPEPKVFGRSSAIAGAAVLVLDRNGYTPTRIAKEVESALAKSWGSRPRRHEAWLLHASTSSAVRVVIAGMPDDPTLKDLGVRKFAIDDYLLLLCLDPVALGELCKKANVAHRPKAGTLRAILEELAERLRARHVRIDSSKRYLDMVRAVLGFPASRATFAGELIRMCPDPTRTRVLGDLAKEITTDPPLPPAA